MTVSYLQGFNPKWYLVQNDGKPAAGGQLFTYDGNNPSLLRAAYQTASSALPYTNPIIFDANGTKGPIYFQLNSAVPGDSYFLLAKDANNNLLWTAPNFTGAGGSGGGSTNTLVDVVNFVINGQLWRASQPLDTFFPTATTLTLAPGAHSAFVPTTNATAGSPGPDVIFAKNNTAATDQLKFFKFTLGTNPFSTDITPQYALQYQCTVLGANESYKYIQFPICPKVENLSNTIVTITFWAIWNGLGTSTIQVFLRQFYGDGTIQSPEQRTSYGIIPITNAWAQYTVTGTTPNANGMTIGECNNDGLFLQLQFPLSQTTDITIAKPALYIGDKFPLMEFESMDQIDSLINSPRTGDVKTSFATAAPLGWVAMNDGSIGSASSAATTRANIDTFPLFALLYVGVSDTFAPVSGGRTAPGNTYAAAVTDYAANKLLTLPLSLGRALAGAGAGAGLTSRSLGQSVGEETHLQTTAELAAHTHTFSAGINFINSAVGGGGTPTYREDGGGTALTINSNGSSTPFNVMQPTSFMNVYIKL